MFPKDGKLGYDSYIFVFRPIFSIRRQNNKGQRLPNRFLEAAVLILSCKKINTSFAVNSRPLFRHSDCVILQIRYLPFVYFAISI